MDITKDNQLYSIMNIFYSNLQLLGFEAFKSSSIVKQYTYGLKNFKLDETMFIQSTYYQKAAELILYFLWNTLDKGGFKKNVKKFPPQDHKEAKEFRMACLKWVEKIKHDHLFPSHVTFFPSHFEESRGERFEYLMMALSSLIVSVKLREKLEAPGGTKFGDNAESNCHFDMFEYHQSFEINKIKAILKSESDRFLMAQRNHAALQVEWLEEGKRLDEFYRNLSNKKRKNNDESSLLRSKEAKLEANFFCTLESVSSNWTQIERLSEHCLPDFDVVTGVAEDHAKKLLIDGDVFKKSLAGNSTSPNHNDSETINLESLFTKVSKKVESAPIIHNSYDVKGLLASLQPRVLQHRSHLSDLKELKERLRANINALKQVPIDKQPPVPKVFDCKEFLIDVAKVVGSEGR